MPAGDTGPPACEEACRKAGGNVGANFLTANQGGDTGCFCVPSSVTTEDGGMGENWCLYTCHDSICSGTAFAAAGTMPSTSCTHGAYTHCPAATVDNEFLNLVDPSKFDPDSQLQSKEMCGQFCTAQGSAGFVWDDQPPGNSPQCVGCIVPAWVNEGDPARQICVQDAPSGCSTRESFVRQDILKAKGFSWFTCDNKCQPKPQNNWCQCDCAYQGPGTEWQCTNQRDNSCANSSPHCGATSTETALGADGAVQGCWYPATPTTAGHGDQDHSYSDSHCMCTCDSGNTRTDSCSWADKGNETKFGCLTKSYYPADTCQTPGQGQQ